MAPPRHVTVLGAGLTGLTTAYRLSQLLPPSSKIVLLDAAHRTGGWVDSSSHRIAFEKDGQNLEGDVVLESGPRSIRPRGSRGAPKMLQLIQNVGLESSIISVSLSHPATKNRFLLDLSSPAPSLTPVRIRPFDSSPLLSGLLSSLFRELFRFRQKIVGEDESVDSFLRRRFGHKVANLAAAMMHGIYAASSTELSAKMVLGAGYEGERRTGSMLWGLIMRLFSRDYRQKTKAEKAEWAQLGQLGKEREKWSMYGLRGGIGGLTDRLADEIKAKGVNIVLGTTVVSLEPSQEGVTIKTTDDTIETDHIVASIPSRVLDTLLPPKSLPHLSHNPATTVGVVSLVFPLPPAEVHPAGFGYLIPRTSPGINPSILGVVFDSIALSALDDLSLEGRITKLTVMMGGPYWSTYASSPETEEPLPIPKDQDDLIQPALDHIRHVFPALGRVEPVLAVPRLHTNCIPTYLPGHVGRMRELHGALGGGEWAGKLSLAGNAYGGVGLNDCIWSAEKVARGVAAGEIVTGLEGIV